MKLTLITLFICFGINQKVKAQNYQTIKSNQTHYFSQSSSLYALATRTDSVKMQGTDSVFYSFSTVRESNDVLCRFVPQAPWYGQKVIIKQNGINEFYNGQGEKISINTQAKLSDTMLIYTFPTGERIFGYVEAHDTSNFLGFRDSVKTILLRCEKLSSFNTKKIKISKNHGWLQVLPFYSFPNVYGGSFSSNAFRNNDPLTDPMLLIGMENPKVGITRLSKAEVYSMQVGDEQRFRGYITNYSSGSGQARSILELEKKLIERNIFGSDSLELKFQIKSRAYLSAYYGYPLGISSRIAIIRLGNLNEYYHPLLPEEYNWAANQMTPSQNYLIRGICGKIVEGTNSIGFDLAFNPPYVNDSSCLNYFIKTPERITNVIQGLGEGDFYNEIFGSGFFTDRRTLSAFSDGTQTCGHLWFIHQNEFKIEEFHLYPNPSSQFINIETQSENKKSIFIYDLKGQLILKTKMRGNFKRVDISELDEGIYILKLINGIQHSHRKIVISDN